MRRKMALPLIRKLGVRKAKEIAAEKNALKVAKGDIKPEQGPVEVFRQLQI
ncbi:MAG: hypothetical protein ACE3JP_12460 [Ectobacillus sp.]